MAARVAGIEAGGTKIVCAVGSGPDDIEQEVRFPTTSPNDTMGRILAFLNDVGPVAAVGIGTFGPCDPNPVSSTYGYITSTPKPGWTNVDLVGPIVRALNVPVGFDTDVNAAVLGEWRWGAGRGLDTLLYLTIGTGIGGGALVNGQSMHGLLHPEMGHIRVPRGEDAIEFAGSCPYHGDCLEGLASGPALLARWGKPGVELEAGHTAWEIEARYLALALHNFICTLSPQRIIMGGGVMEQKQLIPLIRRYVLESLNDYLQAEAILTGMENYIVPPGLGNQAGILGAIALGQMALAGS